jgi:hypothetical protein
MNDRLNVLAAISACLLLSGCAKPEPLPATNATESHNDTALPWQVQRSLQSPKVESKRTLEEIAKAEAELKVLYAKLDALIKTTPSSQHWSPPESVQEALTQSAKNAAIARQGCAQEFCRYVVNSKTAELKEAFVNQFSVEGSIIFNYPSDSPLSVIAYVFKPQADMSKF